MRVGERGEGEGDEQELPERGAVGDAINARRRAARPRTAPRIA